MNYNQRSVFVFPVTDMEIQEVVSKMKGKLSAGYDEIPEYLINECIKYIIGECLLSFRAESLVFQFTIQKRKD
jgi:hypothetical protein